MYIRHARQGDESGIAAVHVQSWQTTYANLLDDDYLQQLSVAQREQAWRASLQKVEHHPILVLENDRGRIVGFVSGGANREPNLAHGAYDGEVYALYLLAEIQGQGWGAQLLRSMLHLLDEQGYHSAVVWALNGNSAITFYQHHGATLLQEKTIRIGGKLYRETALGWDRLNEQRGAMFNDKI